MIKFINYTIILCNTMGLQSACKIHSNIFTKKYDDGKVSRVNRHLQFVCSVSSWSLEVRENSW